MFNIKKLKRSKKTADAVDISALKSDNSNLTDNNPVIKNLDAAADFKTKLLAGKNLYTKNDLLRYKNKLFVERVINEIFDPKTYNDTSKKYMRQLLSYNKQHGNFIKFGNVDDGLSSKDLLNTIYCIFSGVNIWYSMSIAERNHNLNFSFGTDKDSPVFEKKYNYLLCLFQDDIDHNLIIPYIIQRQKVETAINNLRAGKSSIATYCMKKDPDTGKLYEDTNIILISSKKFRKLPAYELDTDINGNLTCNPGKFLSVQAEEEKINQYSQYDNF